MRLVYHLLLPALIVIVAGGAALAQEPTPSEEAALQAYREGAFSRAVQLYTQALSETGDAEHRARLHVRIAWTLFALGKEREVDTHIQAALLEDPDIVLIPDYYTQEFLDLVDRIRRRAADAPAQGDPAIPAPDLEATLASINQRLDSGADLEAALADSERLAAFYPEDERVRPVRVQLLQLLGRPDEALRVEQGLDEPTLDDRLMTAQTSVTDLILRANTLLDQGDVGTSLELLREAVSRQPSNVAALELMAEAARRAARWQEASFALKSALSLQPDNIGLQLRLGEVSLAMGDASAARDVFQQLTERFPHSDRAWAALGLLHASLGKHEVGLQELERALSENPLLPEVQMAVGEMLLDKGDLAGAHAALEAASNLLHDDPQLEGRLGQVLLAMDQPQAALQHLRTATDNGFDPEDVRLALVQAMIGSELLSEAERSLEQIPADPGGDDRVLRGLLLYSRGEYAEAESVLREVSTLRSNDPAVHNLLAAALHRQSRFAEAVQSLEVAVQLSPGSERLATNLEHARAALAAEELRASALTVFAPAP
jgi:tetratricopeptide (TPR) repeat protein